MIGSLSDDKSNTCNNDMREHFYPHLPTPTNKSIIREVTHSRLYCISISLLTLSRPPPPPLHPKCTNTHFTPRCNSTTHHLQDPTPSHELSARKSISLATVNIHLHHHSCHHPAFGRRPWSGNPVSRLSVSIVSSSSKNSLVAKRLYPHWPAIKLQSSLADIIFG